jgi:hypothetical protein
MPRIGISEIIRRNAKPARALNCEFVRGRSGTTRLTKDAIYLAMIFNIEKPDVLYRYQNLKQ